MGGDDVPVTQTSPTIRLLAVCLVAWFGGMFVATPLHASTPDAGVPTLSVDQLEAGMRGHGRTVFRGTRVDTFGVEILGVLENVMPDQDMILIRADRQPILDDTQIMSGMSGSPIYVDGRLIGALAYAWPFQTEPLAGVTPIDEMLKAGPRSASASASAGDAASLRPISTPIVAGGFEPDVRRRFSEVFERKGYPAHFVAGGSPSGTGSVDSASGSLQPGEAVGAQMVRGDLSLTAIGTVTHRREDRIYAFGHQFMNAGRIQLPMTAAEVHAPMPSLEKSFKISSPRQTVGTVVEDRRAALVGRLGRQPDLIPVEITLAVPRDGFEETYRVEVMRNRYLSAGLINGVAANFARGKINQLGINRLISTVDVNIEDRPDIRFRRSDLVEGSFDPWAFLPLAHLWNNPFSDLRVQRVEVELTLEPERQGTRLTDLWVDVASARSGESVGVFVKLRPFRGQPTVRRFEFTLPEGLPAGKVRFRALPASALTGEDAPPKSFDQLVEWFNRPRSPDQLAVVMDYPAPAMNAAGRRMERFPWSLSGAYQRAGESTVAFRPSGRRHFVSLDRAVQGQQSIVVGVRP